MEAIDFIYITTAFTGWFASQAIKVCLNIIIKREGGLNFRHFFSSGGIPSVHTSFVSSVVVVIAIQEGIGTPIFGISLVLLGVVIYDAIGVRKATGENTRALQSILWQSQHNYDSNKLSVHLSSGHTIYQVFVGLLVGVLCGVGNYILFVGAPELRF